MEALLKKEASRSLLTLRFSRRRRRQALALSLMTRLDAIPSLPVIYNSSNQPLFNLPNPSINWICL